VVELLESKSFEGVVGRIDKIEIIKSDPERYIIENSYSGYHLIGGCGHLIDQNFKVDHLGGLYICDASIMTDYVSSNIHSAVALMGDMFAKRLIDTSTKARESIHSFRAFQ
jgi:choline dehydrogenase-like flavoprotein